MNQEDTERIYQIKSLQKTAVLQMSLCGKQDSEGSAFAFSLHVSKN